MDKVVVLDFGGQYAHLISRRIRELGVYAEVLPPSAQSDELKSNEIKGIVFSGGAASVYDPLSPKCSVNVLDLNIPLLGICYGHQLLAHLQKGKVEQAASGEYGLTEAKISRSVLLDGLERNEKVWMNHRDIVRGMPVGYHITASTRNTPIAAFENSEKKIYGVQFHPEVTHTQKGMKIIENFLDICQAKREWNPSLMKSAIQGEIESVVKGKAIIGLSGGIDSATAAILVSGVIGKNLTTVYIDTGLMRHNETENIKKIFSAYDLNVKIVHAGERFFKALRGISDPEQKRKTIGRVFIEVFEEEAKKEAADILIQGTIYSDRIESAVTQFSSKIKSHHNVGGLPKKMKMQVYEPLRNLYKDEVRKLATESGLPPSLVNNHPFPGPGLGIRVIGEVTPEKVEIARKAGFIVEEEVKKAGFYEKVWMAFAVMLPVKSVGIQGDERSYKYPVVVRVVESKDAMTANFSKIPFDLLETISTRITNEIPEVNRVVYDISNKPPATMEWE